jgi:site-specific DNA-methyltransferase (adenine-specific)
MAHLSENTNKLEYIFKGSSLKTEFTENDVWFINLPYYENLHNIPVSSLYQKLNTFIENANRNATIIILSSPIFAADFLSNLSHFANLKLWISVKNNPPLQPENKLKQHHSALLVLTKYKQSLVHTKTRIGYTFCPTCERTTKDYGGKKHLYHEYGTLMSDVWRDISIKTNDFPEIIIDRLQDLFGLKPYKRLNAIDLRNIFPSIHNEHEIKISINEQINDVNNIGIINGDCLEELKKIPSNSIDFCFADPPYNIKKKYESWNDGIDIKEYFYWCDKWLSELARIIKPGKIVAILNIPQWTIRHYKHIIKELNFYDWIVWEGLSLPVRMIMPANYSIACFSKGKPDEIPRLKREINSVFETQSLTTFKEFYCSRASCIKKRQKQKIEDNAFTSNLWWDIHRLKHNSKRVDHPTQLPPKFMQRLISLFTNEGDIVLDPFNGSGTTTLVAEQLKRRFIGIELSEYYYGIAKTRHEEFKNGLDPFRKNDKVPKAKNSYVARLKKQTYEVNKKTLQLEVKEISITLGKIASRNDVIEHSKYPIDYFDNYFINWSEVTAAARTTGMQQVENKKQYSKVQQLRLFEEKKVGYELKRESN